MAYILLRITIRYSPATYFTVNTMKFKIALLTAALVFSTSAFAQNYAEVGDAGQSIATAQDTGSGSVTSITGLFSGSGDVDFFNIYISGGIFSATVSSSTDPMLFLWDSAGNPLLFNDDYFGLQSHIGGSFADGDYILGISQYANGYGLHFADSGWSSDFHGTNSYTISLENTSGTSVPEGGSTLALLGLALCGFSWMRRGNK